MASTAASTNALMPNSKLNNEIEFYNKICNRTLDKTEFEYIENLALNENDISAQLLYGMCSEVGVNTQIDKVKAFQYFQKAKNRPLAQFKLGVYYCNGYGGVQKNRKLAAEWWVAAQSPLSNTSSDLFVKSPLNAQYNLGLCYEQGGDGIERNLLLALTWYDKAARKNHTPSIQAIARLNNASSTIMSQLAENTKLKAQIDALNLQVAGLQEQNEAYMNALNKTQSLNKLLSSQLKNLQESAGNSSSNSSSSSSSTCSTNSSSSRKRPHASIDGSPAAPTFITATPVAATAAAATASTTSSSSAPASASSAVAETDVAAAQLLLLTAAGAAMSPILNQNGTTSSAATSPPSTELDGSASPSKRARTKV
jgi:hypothetical protein